MKHSIHSTSDNTKARYYADGLPANVGDRVTCVDDRASFRRLACGHQYTVAAAYDGTPVVVVDNAYHSTERFVLVGEVQP